MEEFEARFEIESPSDAYAVERLMSALYDSIREESRTIRGESSDSTEMLGQFEAILHATRNRTPGTLRVIFEPREGGFDE